MNRAMKYLLENKFVAVLAAICLIATAAIPAGAQNAANNTAIANQNIRLLAADSIKKASTNSAEKTLQAAVKKDKDGT